VALENLGLGCARLRERAIRHEIQISMELPINGFDASENRAGQLGRRKRATLDELLCLVDGQME
jgi:hypothetical protein